MEIPLDEVIYFDCITTHPTTGAATDADSTPTFAVYEESTDTDIGVGGNLTKRTSLTGNYRGTFTLSAANGFEVGKWYSIIGSATVNAIAGKAVLKNFRVVAAEAIAGKSKVDVDALLGTAWLTPATPGTPDVNTKLAGGTAWGSGAITAAAIATGAIDADALATDAVEEIRNAITGGAYDLDTDANGRIRIVDGTGTGEFDTSSGGVLVYDFTTAAKALIEAEVNDGISNSISISTLLNRVGPFTTSGQDSVYGWLRAMVQKSGITLPAGVGNYDNTTDSLEALRDNMGTAGAGLTAVVWNAAWDAEVQSEAQDALVAYGLDHLLAASVTGTDITDDSIIAKLVSMSATADWDTFDNTTDSLEGLRDVAESSVSYSSEVIDMLGPFNIGLGPNTLYDAIVAIMSADADTPSIDIGNYDPATDSLEAIRNQVVTVDTVVDSILADTGTDGVVVNAAGLATDAVQEIRNAITGGAYALSTDASGMVRIVDGTGTGEIDTTSGAVAVTAASVRSALGLASANLDTQLGDLPTAAENAAALLDLTSGIETGVTPRQALRAIAAKAAGLISGAGLGTEVVKGIGQASGGTTRMTATVDASGNISAWTLNL